MATDLEEEIRKVLLDSFETFGDHAVEDAIAQLYRDRADQLRRLDDHTDR